MACELTLNTNKAYVDDTGSIPRQSRTKYCAVERGIKGSFLEGLLDHSSSDMQELVDTPTSDNLLSLL
jgi:hypothetical protein